jgi:hypothetical protein
MIRKLLSDRALFTVGAVLVTLSVVFDPNVGSAYDDEVVFIRAMLLLAGVTFTAYSLWGLVASLRKEPVTLHDDQGSTDQVQRRNA